MVKLIQPSMAGGEVSAAVGARVDLSKRAVAVERAENFIATFTGSMMHRPGQKFVARAKPGAGQYRIIEFEFNTSQTFVLELGEQYMRFHTLGAQILDSSNVLTITDITAAIPGGVTVESVGHGLSDGDEVFITGVVGSTELNGRNFLVTGVTANEFELQDLNGVAIEGSSITAYVSGGTATPPYEITTPWAADDLFDLNYAQSGDVMTICHPDYPVQELVRIDNDTWTLSPPAFIPEQLDPLSLDVEVNTDVTTVDITNVTQANPAVITTGSTHGLSEGDRVHIAGVVGMVELNRFQYTVTAVPSTTTLQISFVGENLDVDSSGFAAYVSDGTLTTLTRPRRYAVTAVNGDDEEESLRGVAFSVGSTIASISQANPCVITMTEGHGLETFDEVELVAIGGMTEINQERFRVVRIDHLSFSLQRIDGTVVDSTSFTAFTSGGEVRPLFVIAQGSADADWNNTVLWTAVNGAQSYNVYAADNNGLLGFIGSTTSLRFDDVNFGPDYAVTPPIQFNPFDDFAGGGTDRYPGATGFFQQRRWFANSNNFPNRFWASQLGHFSNLSRSIPPLSQDSIVASIAARRINEINHIVPLTDLIMLTSGGEYRLRGSQDGAIQPGAIDVKPQSYYGSTKVRPIVAGDVALFVSPGEFIRDLTYQFSDDKFVGKDVTLLARHLFDFRTIIDWDYAPAPHALGFIVMSDGGGCFLTYQPDQDIYAITRASTMGKYKSTCVVREGDNDIIYVLVERIVNGNTVTFIERMDEGQFKELSDAFHVDAGLTLDNPITITGATAADPIVITAPAHGLSDGDTVDISGIMEVDATVNEGVSLSSDYNGTGFTVANATANTFELQIEGEGVDGSAFAAYSSGGVAREAVTTVSGLWHLEGATVVAAGNGYSQKELMVTDGQVTLGAAASRIHVGLGYFSRLKTLPLSMYADGQTTEGRAKNVTRLTVQVERTMGMWFGPAEDLMREAKFGLPSKYSQPLEMLTDDIDVTMKADWGKRKQVVIEQRDPLPLTVLTLIPDTRLGGN